MSKDPAFSFYPNDYLGGTMGFSILQHGTYLLSLLFQFNNGHFHDADIIPIIGQANWESVQHKFKKDSDGKRYNERLEEEINRRRAFNASRRASAAVRWDKNDKPLSGKKIDDMHTQSIRNACAMRMGIGKGIGKGIGIEIPEQLKEVWNAFIEMRNKIRKPATARAQKNILAEIERLAPKNIELQIKILDQSITNSWQGVFPLREQSQKSETMSPERIKRAMEF